MNLTLDDLLAVDDEQTGVGVTSLSESEACAPREVVRTPGWLKGTTSFDLVAVVAVLVLCAGVAPIATVPNWTPRFALMVAVLPVGLLLLVRLALRRDRAALAALAALLWCGATALLQVAPAVTLVGQLGLEASVLIYAGAIGCWAIGRSLSDRGRELLGPALLGALALCGVVGLLQIVLQIEGGSLAMGGHRANGLTSYSVYYGALMSGAAVLLATRRSTGRWRWIQVVGVAGFALASSLSGSRAALGAVLVGTVCLALRHRTLRSISHIGAVIGGTLGGVALNAWFGEGSSSLQRLNLEGQGSGVGIDQLAGGGVRWRLDVWRAGWEAWLDRPFTGWGLGNFRQAVQGRMPASYSDDSALFDAHNIVIELLVAVGVAGLALFVAFGVLTARGARGPLALTAYVIALSWMLEPAALATLPLTLLLVGAASHVRTTRDDDLQTRGSAAVREVTAAAKPSREVVAALAIGAALAGVFLVADARLAAARDGMDPHAAEAAARFFPTDPVVADLVARLWTADGVLLDGVEPAMPWAEQAVARQPDGARWRISLARHQLQVGDHVAAEATLRTAIDLDPQLTGAWELMWRLGTDFGDPQLAGEAMERLCGLGSDLCGSE